VDILLAAVILVITVKTFIVAIVVKGFGYSNKTSLLVSLPSLFECTHICHCSYSQLPLVSFIGRHVSCTNRRVRFCSP
jgi:predicted Kef-type K+ transport protein